MEVLMEVDGKAVRRGGVLRRQRCRAVVKYRREATARRADGVRCIARCLPIALAPKGCNRKDFSSAALSAAEHRRANCISL
jgi:hypothetical protein